MTQTYFSSPTNEPLPQELQVFRDNTWTLTVVNRQVEDGAAFDLTDGWHGWFVMKARDTHSDSNILIEKRTDVAGEGEIVVPATAGTVRFFFERADTRDLKSGVYFWDSGIFRGTEKITTSKGQLELKQPVLLGDVPA